MALCFASSAGLRSTALFPTATSVLAPERVTCKRIRTQNRVRIRLVPRAAVAAASNGTTPKPPPPQARPEEQGPQLSPKDARASLAGLFRMFMKLAAREPFILRRLILALLCVVAAKVISLMVPLQFKRAVDALSLTGTVGGAAAATALAHAVGAFLLVAIATSAAREFRNGVFARAGQRVGRRITAQAFTHILGQDAAFHAASATGALTRVVDRGTRSVLTIFRGLLFSFGPTVLELILVCGVLWTSFSLWYVGVTLATFAVYIFYTFQLNDEMARIRAESNSIDNESGAKLADAFFNVDSVTAFNAFRFESERYDASLKRAERLGVRNEWLFVFLNFGQATIYWIGLTIMMWRCGMSILAGTMSIGSFAMLYTMLQQLWVPLNFLGWQYREVKQSLIDLQNLFSVLERQSTVSELPDAKNLQVTGGEVRFERVSFTYPKQSMDLDFIQKPKEFGSKMEDETEEENDITPRKQAIKELTFTAKPGATLAIVGPSGSGKSSTMKLLYRLYDLDSGRILIDGQDISKVTLSSLRESVSIVPQDTVLFNDTVRYNIAYGRPSATDTEVIEAAKAARIHNTIMRMPQGYETLVGERGVRLSGGERQRLSVARAFLKGSRIVLEDESTSSLDSAMEQEVTKALRELGMNRTRLVIAHRLSTIADADQIVVIRQGDMVEQGTHDQLLKKENGLYRELWLRQQDKSFQPSRTVVERKIHVLHHDHRSNVDDPAPRPHDASGCQD